MTIKLSSGVQIDVHGLDAALQHPGPLDADGLIVPAAPLRDVRALTALGRRLDGSRCALVAVLGEGAERVHDELDALLVGEASSVELVPTTTWHEDEDPEDVLRLVEQMVLSSEKRSGQPLILVLNPSAVTPVGLPGVLHMLSSM